MTNLSLSLSLSLCLSLYRLYTLYPSSSVSYVLKYRRILFWEYVNIFSYMSRLVLTFVYSIFFFHFFFCHPDICIELITYR